MNREVGNRNEANGECECECENKNGSGNSEIDSTETLCAPSDEQKTNPSSKPTEERTEADKSENNSELKNPAQSESANANDTETQFPSEQDRQQEANNVIFEANTIRPDEATGEKKGQTVIHGADAKQPQTALNCSVPAANSADKGINACENTDTKSHKRFSPKHKASGRISVAFPASEGTQTGHEPNAGSEDDKNNSITAGKAALGAAVPHSSKRRKNIASGADAENGSFIFVPDKDSRQLVSRIAYLAGIPKFAIFTPARKYDRAIYDMLENNREARIIRSLCLLRAAIMKAEAASADKERLLNAAKTPANVLCAEKLRADGITIRENYPDYLSALTEINGFIEENINKCREFFPEGIVADYLTEIFIMPNGKAESGVEKALEAYKSNIRKYPYQVYLNWQTIAESKGYLLKDDFNFVLRLYAFHNTTMPASKPAAIKSEKTPKAADAKPEGTEKTVEAGTTKTEPVEAGTVEAEAVEAATVEAETVKAETVETAPVEEKTVETGTAEEKAVEAALTEKVDSSEKETAGTEHPITERSEAESTELKKTEQGSETENENGNGNAEEESFELLSVIAYLAGADKSVFCGENAKLSCECFNGLENNVYAENIRNLCIIRHSIMHEFYNINEALREGPKALDELSGFIPAESVRLLAENGFDILKPNAVLYQQLYKLNGLIEANIDFCKELFPAEPEWKYLRSLFIMPRGTAANGSGVTAARRFYRSNIRYTPDNVYLNWGHNGRIRNGFFKNDAAFLNAFRILHSQDEETSDDRQEEPEAFAPDSFGEEREEREETETAEAGQKAEEVCEANNPSEAEPGEETGYETEKAPVELITLTAYMLGCKMELFLNAGNQYDYRQYSELNKVPSATAIRNLCRVRSAIIDRFHSINELMKNGNKRLSDCNHLIPASCIDSLFDVGINIAGPLDSLYEHLYRINAFIEENIDNCKELFPTDIKWKYIRSLFIMPKGTDAAGVTAARSAYKENVKNSPDQWSYINRNDSYQPQYDFFKNDDTFLLCLYRMNGDSFDVLEDEYKAFEKPAEQPEKSETKAQNSENPDETAVYNVVTVAAYLLGAPPEAVKTSDSVKCGKVFSNLAGNKPARILRNLCLLRTAFIKNFEKLSAVMQGESDSDGSESKLLPTDAAAELETDGVRLDASCNTIEESIITLNRMIAAGFEECKELFPLWLDYSVVRSVFVMTDGERFPGVRRAVANYRQYKKAFPGEIYMNRTDGVNILENDRVFVNSVYKGNSASLIDQSRTSSRGAVQTAARLNDFIRNSERVEFVVDCENANPLRFFSALKSIESALTAKIAGITLYDDTNASTIWKSFSKYVDIPVVHETYERISMEKSLVDINLSVGVCRKFYKDGVDSFAIVSSDSDYWALINSLVDAKFLMLVEKNNFSDNFRRGLAMAGINFCMMDNFYSGDNDDMIRQELSFQSQRYLAEHLALNVNAMIDDACQKARIAITPTERKQLFESYLKSMKLQIAPDGSVSIAVSEG